MSEIFYGFFYDFEHSSMQNTPRLIELLLLAILEQSEKETFGSLLPYCYSAQEKTHFVWRHLKQVTTVLRVCKMWSVIAQKNPLIAKKVFEAYYAYAVAESDYSKQKCTQQCDGSENIVFFRTSCNFGLPIYRACQLDSLAVNCDDFRLSKSVSLFILDFKRKDYFASKRIQVCTSTYGSSDFVLQEPLPANCFLFFVIQQRKHYQVFDAVWFKIKMSTQEHCAYA